MGANSGNEERRILERVEIEAHGVKLSCLEHGEGERRALLLHGFPDDAGTMRGLMQRLAEKGYRCQAPYLRGYGPSDKPLDGNYRLEAIAGDVIALAGKLSDLPVLLIGHDWGAVITYIAASQRPDLFDRIVTMAVPPVATFGVNLRRFPAQIRRSWYMFFFQFRGIADWAVRRKDFAFIDRLWRDWSPGWSCDPERMQEVKASLGAPGSLKAALGYYRQNLSLKPQKVEPIAVPALVMSGRNDGCIGVEMYEGLERDFSAPVRFEVIENAGHFAHLEQPEDVWRRIERFLDETSV